jgi:hypothetical protein
MSSPNLTQTDGARIGPNSGALFNMYLEGTKFEFQAALQLDVVVVYLSSSTDKQCFQMGNIRLLPHLSQFTLSHPCISFDGK